MRALPDRVKTGGVVRIHFTVQRSGLVTESGLASSSGNEELDQAVLTLIPAGSKVAPFPEGMDLPSLLVTTPLRFNAGRSGPP